MAGKNEEPRHNKVESHRTSRRDFFAFAAGFIVATGAALGRDQQVIETNVEVKTPDGVCDAVFIHPARGSHPGVLIWHDSPGLRPVMRNLGKRIAGESALGWS